MAAFGATKKQKESIHRQEERKGGKENRPERKEKRKPWPVAVAPALFGIE